jgi:hypothetical protein
LRQRTELLPELQEPEQEPELPLLPLLEQPLQGPQEQEPAWEPLPEPPWMRLLLQLLLHKQCR